MAAPISQGRAVDLLPKPIQAKVIEMMISDESSRSISQWLLQQGHKLSFAAIARYKRVDLPKHLSTARKLQQLNADSGDVTALTKPIADVTKAVLAAQPILARVNWMWDEIRGGVDESKAKWVESGSGERTYVASDLKARAALLNVARGVTETEAKALQLPGFTSAPSASVTVNNIVVLPAGSLGVQAGEVIDVEAEDVSNE